MKDSDLLTDRQWKYLLHLWIEAGWTTQALRNRSLKQAKITKYWTKTADPLCLTQNDMKKLVAMLKPVVESSQNLYLELNEEDTRNFG